MSQDSRPRYTHGSNSNKSGSNAAVNEAILYELITSHKEEVKYKQLEMQVRGKELEQAHELAMKNIKLQEEYLRNVPKHIFKTKLLLYASLISVVLIIAGVFMYCIYSGNQEIAMRIIELTATTVISGGGGYALGSHKKEKSKEPSVEVIGS